MATTTASAAQSTFTPWIDPPAGVESNLKNPETLTQKTIITISIALLVVTIFFACRVWARAIIKRTWIAEDCKDHYHKLILGRLLTWLE